MPQLPHARVAPCPAPAAKPSASVTRRRIRRIRGLQRDARAGQRRDRLQRDTRARARTGGQLADVNRLMEPAA